MASRAFVLDGRVGRLFAASAMLGGRGGSRIRLALSEFFGGSSEGVCTLR